MSATKTLPRVQRDSGRSPRMLHRLDPKRPMHALCGKKLVELVDHVTEADCVVCEHLWRNR